MPEWKYKHRWRIADCLYLDAVTQVSVQAPPKPALVAADLLVLTKAEACVRSYLQMFVTLSLINADVRPLGVSPGIYYLCKFSSIALVV